MAIDDKSSPLHQVGKFPWWRSSLYQEPVWVSIAWIVGPIAAAALAIFYAIR